MNIAVIPARGGSKRIPRKNIKEFCGKPMIAYAIEAAQKSQCFEHIIVSTDDDEIADVAKKYGAEVPFMRPKELADDYTPTVPVIASAIKSCEIFNWKIEYLCCIYPGVPLIQDSDIVTALMLLKNSDSNYCFPVAEYPSAIQRALKRNQNGNMMPFYPEFELTRTQDLELAFYDAGQFYWGRKDAWLTNSKLHSGGLGMPISAWRVIDIDTQEDWQRAEIMFNVMKG